MPRYKYVNGNPREMTALELQEVDARTAAYNASLKDRLKAYLFAYRESVELGGITITQSGVLVGDKTSDVAGRFVPSDLKTSARLDTAWSRAKADSNYTISSWTVRGVPTNLSNAEIIAIAEAVHDHVAKCFTVQDPIIAAINAGTYTTEAQVKAAFDTAMED